MRLSASGLRRLNDGQGMKKGMNDSGKKDRGIICDVSVFFVQDAMIHCKKLVRNSLGVL